METQNEMNYMEVSLDPSLKNEEIDLNSGSSDVEIVDIRKNIEIATKINKAHINIIRKRIRAKIRKKYSGDNCIDKKRSSNPEEVVINDSDSDTQIEKSKRLNKDDIRAITLNCPRCNKLVKLFCTTLTTSCSDCKISMNCVCDECQHRYDSITSLYRHQKWQCKSVLPGISLHVHQLIICRCTKCDYSSEMPSTNAKNALLCPTCKNICLTFVCKICFKPYTSYSGIHRHAKEQCQPQRETYYCDHCHFQTRDMAILVSHLVKVHPEPKSDKLKCKKCDASFADSNSLSSHKSICTAPSLECKFCKHSLKYTWHMEMHIRSQHPQKVSKLQEIMAEITNSNKVTFSKNEKNEYENELKLQKMRQTYCNSCKATDQFVRGITMCAKCKSKLQYKCGECNKICSQSTLLYRHVYRTHGQSIFMCRICSKKFRFISDLNEHIKVCGQEPSFSCTLCLFKTHYRYNLKKHVDKVHADNPEVFTCNECGVEFKVSKSLTKHLKQGCTNKKVLI